MAHHDLIRTVAPAAALFSVEDAKAWLHVDADDSDDRIEFLIEAATAFLDGFDGYLGRALVTQTWALHLPAFPGCGQIAIPLRDLIAVTSVTYKDGAGATQTLSSASYHVLDGRQSRLVLVDGQSWPTTAIQPRAVTVTFTCGYGGATDVPKAILAAAKRMIEILYDGADVGSAADAVSSVKAILAPFRHIPV
jgi:uncharacterized phiE125 gp8 family phage protein